MEMLVTATLTLMTVGTICTFSQAQLKALAAQGSFAQSQSVTRSALDLMARELRMASLDPTNLALPTSVGLTCPGVKQGIVEATPTKLHFRQDLNADGALTAAGEDVTYDQLAGQIRRSDGAAQPVALVDFVPAGGLVFRYFDGSNPPIELVPAGSALTATQRDCVAKVRVTLSASMPNPNPNISTPISSIAESEVAIRNRSLLNF
jgi:hypothetical protein